MTDLIDLAWHKISKSEEQDHYDTYPYLNEVLDYSDTEDAMWESALLESQFANDAYENESDEPTIPFIKPKLTLVPDPTPDTTPSINQKVYEFALSKLKLKDLREAGAMFQVMPIKGSNKQVWQDVILGKAPSLSVEEQLKKALAKERRAENKIKREAKKAQQQYQENQNRLIEEWANPKPKVDPVREELDDLYNAERVRWDVEEELHSCNYLDKVEYWYAVFQFAQGVSPHPLAQDWFDRVHPIEFADELKHDLRGYCLNENPFGWNGTPSNPFPNKESDPNYINEDWWKTGNDDDDFGLIDENYIDPLANAMNILGLGHLQLNQLTMLMIKQSRNNLAKMHHTDLGGNNDKMVEINAAYELVNRNFNRQPQYV